jgi:dihydrofolate reductase
MGRIIVSEIVSLDGVAQDPTGEEGVGLSAWFLQAGEGDRRAWAEFGLDEARSYAAILLGRRSDEWFAARWTSRTGEWADRLNGLPKYVVSSTLSESRWTNGTVLKGAVVDEVAALKREVDGDIVVFASIRLVHTLMEHGLVDELRLTVFPVVVGAGERLLGTSGGTTPMQRVAAHTLGEGLVHLVHRPVGRTAG